jgi:hypothetical protein
VFPHTCYAVRVEGRVLGGRTRVQVAERDLEDPLSRSVPFTQTTEAPGLVFSSAGERRVTVTLKGSASSILLKRVRLIRLPKLRNCG